MSMLQDVFNLKYFFVGKMFVKNWFTEIQMLNLNLGE